MNLKTSLSISQNGTYVFKRKKCGQHKDLGFCHVWYFSLLLFHCAYKHFKISISVVVYLCSSVVEQVNFMEYNIPIRKVSLDQILKKYPSRKNILQGGKWNSLRQVGSIMMLIVIFMDKYGYSFKVAHRKLKYQVNIVYLAEILRAPATKFAATL